MTNKYIVYSYSELDGEDMVVFDDANASLSWFNRQLTSDIYKLEYYLIVEPSDDNFLKAPIEFLIKIREQ